MKFRYDVAGTTLIPVTHGVAPVNVNLTGGNKMKVICDLADNK
jgi:hypothetical protein